MTEKKVQFEYGLNYTSESILWDAISTPSGLKEWFADQVKFDGKNVTFLNGGRMKTFGCHCRTENLLVYRFNGPTRRFRRSILR
jgi:hypothetical protein